MTVTGTMTGVDGAPISCTLQWFLPSGPTYVIGGPVVDGVFTQDALPDDTYQLYAWGYIPPDPTYPDAWVGGMDTPALVVVAGDTTVDIVWGGAAFVIAPPVPPVPAARGKRADIVAALSTVEGLSVTPTRPETVVPGAAWPVWRQTVWRNQVVDGARESAWYVYVALPSGPLDATIVEADPLVESVGDALITAELGVGFVEPYYITVEQGGQSVPVLRYSLGDLRNGGR